MPDFAMERKLGGLVAGVDEAGRGPLAGPVVTAAVILMPALLPRKLLRRIDDSKVVKPEERAEIAAALWAAARAKSGVIAALGAAGTAEIASRNILHATLAAMARAVGRLAVKPAHVLVDGNMLPPGLPCPARAVVDGDALCLSIAAASILAKVTRDRLMARLAERWPGYGWDHNFGYGTAEHQAAIRVAGATPHHRMTFSPFSKTLL